MLVFGKSDSTRLSNLLQTHHRLSNLLQTQLFKKFYDISRIHN